MKLTKKQIKFLEAALSTDEARKELGAIWSISELHAGVASNGFMLHAIPCDAQSTFAFRAILNDDRIEIALSDMEEDKAPQIIQHHQYRSRDEHEYQSTVIAEVS